MPNLTQPLLMVPVGSAVAGCVTKPSVVWNAFSSNVAVLICSCCKPMCARACSLKRRIAGLGPGDKGLKRVTAEPIFQFSVVHTQSQNQGIFLQFDKALILCQVDVNDGPTQWKAPQARVTE